MRITEAEEDNLSAVRCGKIAKRKPKTSPGKNSKKKKDVREGQTDSREVRGIVCQKGRRRGAMESRIKERTKKKGKPFNPGSRGGGRRAVEKKVENYRGKV